jgi:hypothetical protein
LVRVLRVKFISVAVFEKDDSGYGLAWYNTIYSIVFYHKVSAFEEFNKRGG